MRLLIYPFYLFWTFIKNNITKSITLIVVAICLYGAYYTKIYDDVVVETKIVGSLKLGNQYHYLFEPDDKTFKSLVSDKPLVFKNSIYKHKESKDLFCVLAFIGWLVLFILIVTIFASHDDEDINWEIQNCCKEAFQILVTCEFEEGSYYYIALGRLIDERKQMRSYSGLNVRGFADLWMCPKFKTKTQRRNEVLSKLV